MKKIIIFILLILGLENILSNDIADKSIVDPTNDSITIDKKNKSGKTDLGVKLRGEFYLGLAYMPEYRDGIKPVNRFSQPNINGIDYTDSGDPRNKHHTGDGRIIGGSNGSILAGLFSQYSFIVPFLTADNPLMKNNNIKFTFIEQLSPITWDGGFSITFTPLACFQFEIGFLLGFGWTLSDNLAGLGINDNGVIKRFKAGGPHIQLWFAPTLQFDIAYLMPKAYQRWTHIVALATPKLIYEALLIVSENQPWMYQEDAGERLNGWQFQGDFYFGYRFYIIEDDIGENQRFLKRVHKNFILTLAMYVWIEYFNLSHFFDSPMKESGWGSDFVYIDFGPAIVMDLPMNFFLKAAFLFGNDKAYTSSTVGNRYYQDRIYKDWYVYFRWIRMGIGWKF